MLRRALAIALVLLVATAAGAQADGADVRLAVPYRSQLDGTPYARANCGPTSVAMVLAAFGIERRTHDLRLRANQLQGTWGYNDGVAIEHLATIVREHGLQVYGLWEGEGFHRWTLDEARAALRAGRPVIPQVWYRALPGRWTSPYQFDHYIVLVGTVGEDFLYHDPIDEDHPGAYRTISAEQLTKAWRSSDVPWAAFAVGPEGLSPLRPQPQPQPTKGDASPMRLSRAAADAVAPAAGGQSVVPNAPWRVMLPPEPAAPGGVAARAALTARGADRRAASDASAGPVAAGRFGLVRVAEAQPADARSVPAAVAPGDPLTTLALALRQLVAPLLAIFGG